LVRVNVEQSADAVQDDNYRQLFSVLFTYPNKSLLNALDLLLVACSLFAAGGAVFSTPLRIPEGTRWYQHYATMVWSGALTGLAAAGYTIVHFALIKS
jgi:hypothetical protein